MNATAKPQSLIVSMATRYGMDPVQFAKTVRATAMPSKHTEEQFAAFMLVANTYGLNPVLREVYAYPTRNGGIAPVVSIDGWVHLVNSHPDINGFSFSFHDDENGNPISVTCSMWRKSREMPVVVTEYYNELYRNTEPWNAMPRRMMRHKAFKEAARYAFGLAGIHDEDEVRELGDAVAEIEHEIPSADLEAFAAIDVVVDEDTGNGADAPLATPTDAGSPGDSSDSPPVAAGSPDEGGSAASAQGAAAAPTITKAEAIERLLTLACDKSLQPQERLEVLDSVQPIYADNFPAEFVKPLIDTAAKVARGELKAPAARKYLEGL